MTFEAVRDMGDVVALMALLAVAYGTAVRALPCERSAQAVLGALFGAAAVLAMLDPVTIAPGLIADGRNLPVALAGAFLGWPGALVAGGMAAVARLAIGGAGAVPALAGIAVAAGAGLWWAHGHRDAPRGPGALLRLAALSGACFVTPFVVAFAAPSLLPPGAAAGFATRALPVLVPLHVAGVLLAGSLLERERRLLGTERRLAIAASRDPLTGLLNRRGLDDAAARLPPGPVAALILDLDHFKRVNDIHGHDGGDAVLRALGPRLRRAAGPGAVLARLGGEEVALLLPGLGADGVAAMGAALCAAVRDRPFRLPTGQASVTASVGGAWARGGADLPALLARADRALYAAKRAGRDRSRMDGEEVREAA